MDVFEFQSHPYVSSVSFKTNDAVVYSFDHKQMLCVSYYRWMCGTIEY